MLDLSARNKSAFLALQADIAPVHLSSLWARGAMPGKATAVIYDREEKRIAIAMKAPARTVALPYFIVFCFHVIF